MPIRIAPLARPVPLLRFILAVALLGAVMAGAVRPLLSWASPASSPEPAIATAGPADLAAIIPRAGDFEAAGLPPFRTAGGRWLDRAAWLADGRAIRQDELTRAERRAGLAQSPVLGSYELTWYSAATGTDQGSTTIWTTATQFVDDASAEAAITVLAGDGEPRDISGTDLALLSSKPGDSVLSTTLTVRVGAILLAIEVAPEEGGPLLGDEALVAQVLVQPAVDRLVATGTPPATGLSLMTPRLPDDAVLTVHDGYVLRDGEGIEAFEGFTPAQRAESVADWQEQGIVSWYRVDQDLSSPGDGAFAAELITFAGDEQAIAFQAGLIPAGAEPIELIGAGDPVAAWVRAVPDTRIHVATAIWRDGATSLRVSVSGPTRETTLAAMGELAAGVAACREAGTCLAPLPVPAALDPVGLPATPMAATPLAATPVARR
ncbi:MAG TPA: hypothetical protein VGT61_10350 [Thermomicrobiales bacterium]|jgi:hypothetical protein|nr:hypothetical protein [Thermomicrobiales bacterium]